uniref:Solute carrier family 22 member 13a n=1 Tax=Myripristis murdjan TaxID=586833 RepID=A0A667ZRD8_9TELE
MSELSNSQRWILEWLSSGRYQQVISTVNMSDFGEILKAIGGFGLFQKLILFALCFPNLILPFHFASVFFVQSDPERHCNTDWILSVSPNLTTEEQLNLTLPREKDGTFSKCQMFVPVDWDIDTIRKYGLSETTGCQSGWKYDRTLYEFDLACDKVNLVQVAQTIMMAGILVGSLLFGPFAESFGCKRATQIPVVIMLIFTITTGMCPSFYLYIASQFMVGVGYGGYRLNSVILANEWTGVAKRSLGSCLSQSFAAVGQSLLAGMVYFIRDWRLAQMVIVAPLVVVAIYIWCVYSRISQLVDRGRTKEAKKWIFKVASINKRTIPDSLLEEVVSLHKKLLFHSSFRCGSGTSEFSLNVTYFCLSFSVGNFGLDIFVTQLVFELTELPVWGRKLSLISTLMTGRFLCIFTLAVPQGNAVAVTTLATAGQFFMNWARGIYVITTSAEIWRSAVDWPPSSRSSFFLPSFARKFLKTIHQIFGEFVEAATNRVKNMVT